VFTLLVVEMVRGIHKQHFKARSKMVHLACVLPNHDATAMIPGV
jgi:hypothetical protein